MNKYKIILIEHTAHYYDIEALTELEALKRWKEGEGDLNEHCTKFDNPCIVKSHSLNDNIHNYDIENLDLVYKPSYKDNKD